MLNNKEELRQRNKDAAQRSALFWIGLANERDHEIIRQLLSLSAILIPLSASILLTTIHLTQIIKNLLLVSWGTMVVSIICGFIQLNIDIKYFVKLSQDSSTREVLWSNTTRDFDEINQDINELGETPDASDGLAMVLQFIFFLLGLSSLIIIGILLLYAHTS